MRLVKFFTYNSRWFTFWYFVILMIVITSCSALNPSLEITDSASPPFQDLEATITSQDPALISSPDSLTPANVRFQHLSVENGLSSSSIMFITQDSLGYLWIATSQGLNRYDGYEFKSYLHDPQDPGSLSNDMVYVVYEDHLEELWVGTVGGGLNRLDRATDSFIHYRHDPDDPGSLSSDIIFTIYEDSSGRLWIGTIEGGLARYDRENDRFVSYQHDEMDPLSLASNDVFSILEDQYGELWVGTFGGGLHKFNPQTGKFVNYRYDPNDPSSLSSDNVVSLFEDSQGVFWIGTDGGGLNRFDRQTGTFTHFRHNPNNRSTLSNDVVFVITEDQAGVVWVGTLGGGVNRFNREEENFTRYLNDPDDPWSLSNDYVNAMNVDREGILWVGTAIKLNKFYREMGEFIPYRLDPFDPDSYVDVPVMSIYEDSRGVLWIGSESGLYSYEPIRGRRNIYVSNLDIPDTLSHDWVNVIHEDHEGKIWIGTEGGINRYLPETDNFVRYQDVFTNTLSWLEQQVTVIYEDHSGELWVGTESGLMAYNQIADRFTHHHIYENETDQITRESIAAIYEPEDGILWVAIWDTGILTFNTRSGEFSTPALNAKYPEGLGSRISLFFEDSQDRLWVGTADKGLIHYDRANETFEYFAEEQGFPSSTIMDIQEDKEGNLWVSTKRGLAKFDPRTGSINSFDVRDGLQSNEFYSASTYKRSGQMLFGSISGITAFYPERVGSNIHSPPVVLTSLTQAGEEIELSGSIEYLDDVTLAWPDNDFEFEFVGLSYARPDKNQYAYMLDGYDQDWNYTGNLNFGRYTSLPGGTYTLRLIASNNDGVWNRDGVSIQVTIVPPFWDTLWFRGLVMIVVMGSVIGGYRMRVKSVEGRSRELEKQVQERTFEIEQRRKELEALYRADEEMHYHLHLDGMLQALVDVAVDILQAEKASVLVSDESHQEYVMRVARGFSPEAIEKLHFDRFEGIVGQVAASREPAVVMNAKNDPRREQEREEVVQVVLDEGISSFMHIPIVVNGAVFGIFNVCYTEIHAFGEDEVRLFQALVQRAGLAIENIRLNEDLQELAVAEERNRLARELHDSAKQKTFAALAQLGAAKSLLDKAPSSAMNHVDEAEGLVHDVLQELIILIQEMYPVALREQGLIEAVQDYAYEWAAQTGIHIETDLACEYQLPIELEQAVYRIIQEALANVSRHSQAQKASLTLRCSLGDLLLEIADDGMGFNPTGVPMGLGLRSMRERAARFGAELKIESQSGHGTRIWLNVPLGQILPVSEQHITEQTSRSD